MCPCSPLDVSLPLPPFSTANPIPGFGIPSALKLPNLNPFDSGFPEDLLDIFNKLSMLVPPGILRPSSSPNFSKDIFDAILSLLDQFFPFLMLYKMFLPALNLLLCILEVLCSISNPFKLTRAMRRLFRVCLPQFLNLFPIFALIAMLISLLLLLLALIEYILSQLLKLINALLRNINALIKSFQEANDTSVLSIAHKIGSLLCIFQNLFVLLSLFSLIIGVIKDVLALSFGIPPCDSSDPENIDSCCTPSVCPNIVKQNYTRTTGTLQYLNKVGINTSLTLSPLLGNFVFDVRPESWQIFDPSQEIAQKFINIVDGYDVPPPKPTFFPTDANYSADTQPMQAAYTIDLRVFYNPTLWGRTGDPRFIRFKDCIVIQAPTTDLTIFDTTSISEPTGVITLAGGSGFEDDNMTILTGFASDGITPISDQATLENFIHKPASNAIVPIFNPTDGYTFSNMEYTFKPNFPILFSKNLVTLGCGPDLALDRTTVNTLFSGDAAIKTAQLTELLNSIDFPNTLTTQECLTAALSTLRNEISIEGVAHFEATATICLNQLRDNTNKTLGKLIGIGFDACKSDFTITPTIQFTSKSIKIKVNVKERNGLSIVTGLSTDVAKTISDQLKAHASFGDVSNFTYDGYGIFEADLTSKTAGKGTISISLDSNIFCTNIVPSNLDEPVTHDLQVLDYQFVYTPGIPSVGIGDESEGIPRRDESDLSRDSIDSGSKDGV